VHIGTDASEWWTSTELLDDPAVAGDGDIQVVADDLHVHVQGDVVGGGPRAVHQPQRRRAASPDY